MGTPPPPKKKKHQTNTPKKNPRRTTPSICWRYFMCLIRLMGTGNFVLSVSAHFIFLLVFHINVANILWNVHLCFSFNIYVNYLLKMRICEFYIVLNQLMQQHWAKIENHFQDCVFLAYSMCFPRKILTIPHKHFNI